MEKRSMGPVSKQSLLVERQAILVAPKSCWGATMALLFFSNFVEPRHSIRPINLGERSQLLLHVSQARLSLHGFEIPAFPGNQERAPGESENQREREK